MAIAKGNRRYFQTVKEDVVKEIEFIADHYGITEQKAFGVVVTKGAQDVASEIRFGKVLRDPGGEFMEAISRIEDAVAADADEVRALRERAHAAECEGAKAQRELDALRALLVKERALREQADARALDEISRLCNELGEQRRAFLLKNVLDECSS